MSFVGETKESYLHCSWQQCRELFVGFTQNIDLARFFSDHYPCERWHESTWHHDAAILGPSRSYSLRFDSQQPTRDPDGPSCHYSEAVWKGQVIYVSGELENSETYRHVFINLLRPP
jgi:hypothetical protein